MRNKAEIIELLCGDETKKQRISSSSPSLVGRFLGSTKEDDEKFDTVPDKAFDKKLLIPRQRKFSEVLLKETSFFKPNVFSDSNNPINLEKSYSSASAINDSAKAQTISRTPHTNSTDSVTCSRRIISVDDMASSSNSTSDLEELAQPVTANLRPKVQPNMRAFNRASIISSSSLFDLKYEPCTSSKKLGYIFMTPNDAMLLKTSVINMLYCVLDIQTSLDGQPDDNDVAGYTFGHDQTEILEKISGKECIRLSTLPGIIQRLVIADSVTDHDFLMDFLRTYRYFANGVDVSRILIMYYVTSNTIAERKFQYGTSEPLVAKMTTEERSSHIQLRILNLYKKWLTDQPSDFVNDPLLTSILKTFLTGHVMLNSKRAPYATRMMEQVNDFSSTHSPATSDDLHTHLKSLWSKSTGSINVITTGTEKASDIIPRKESVINRSARPSALLRRESSSPILLSGKFCKSLAPMSAGFENFLVERDLQCLSRDKSLAQLPLEVDGMPSDVLSKLNQSSATILDVEIPMSMSERRLSLPLGRPASPRKIMLTATKQDSMENCGLKQPSPCPPSATFSRKASLNMSIRPLSMERAASASTNRLSLHDTNLTNLDQKLTIMISDAEKRESDLISCQTTPEIVHVKVPACAPIDTSNKALLSPISAPISAISTTNASLLKRSNTSCSSASSIEAKIRKPGASIGLRSILNPLEGKRLNFTESSMSLPNILELDPEPFAQQLALIEQKLFKSIAINEFYQQTWNNKSKTSMAPNLLQSINWFNNIALGVASEVVRQPILKTRVAVLKKLILTAQIVAGLNMSSITRLKKTWKELSKKYLEIWHSLNRIVSNEGSYRAYRANIKQNKDKFGDIPILPYVGVNMSDLTFTEDGNPSFYCDQAAGSSLDVSATRSNSLPLINFGKMRLISQILSNILDQQRAPQYNYAVDSKIQFWILDIWPLMAEADLFAASLLCEPRKI